MQIDMFLHALLQVQKEMLNNKNAAEVANLAREEWHSWDPMLLSGKAIFCFIQAAAVAAAVGSTLLKSFHCRSSTN